MLYNLHCSQEANDIIKMISLEGYLFSRSYYITSLFYLIVGGLIK